MEGQVKKGKTVDRRGGRALLSENAVGGSFMEEKVMACRGVPCGPACSSTTSKEKDAGGAVEGRVKIGKTVGRRGGRALSSEEAVGGSFTEDRVLASRGACCGPACSSTTSKEKVAGGDVEGPNK